MKCSLGISNFLEEISSLSHSIVFLYFFALIIKEGFLISPCFFFGTLHSNGYIFPFLLCFSFIFFTQLFVRPPQTTILPFFTSFSWGWSLSRSPAQCYEPPSIGLQALCLSDLITELGLPQMTAYLLKVLQKCKTKSFKLFIPFNSNITFAGFKEIILFICKYITINCSF